MKDNYKITVKFSMLSEQYYYTSTLESAMNLIAQAYEAGALAKLEKLD